MESYLMKTLLEFGYFKKYKKKEEDVIPIFLTQNKHLQEFVGIQTGLS